MTDLTTTTEEKLPTAFEAFLPALIETPSADVQERFLEFFAAQLRNKNTRAAYGRASSAGPIGRGFPFGTSPRLPSRPMSSSTKGPRPRSNST